MKLSRNRPLLGLLAAGAIACGEAPTDPALLAIAGTYEATTLIGLDTEGPVDALEAGASITLVLRADGTTEGTFFIPDALTEGPGDYEVSLEGAWSASGTTVVLEHDVITFMREVQWTYDGEAGTLEVHTTDVEAVLTRQ